MGKAFDIVECADRASWLKQRHTGIGGSDAAAVLGVSPWRGPLDVFAEKTGLIPRHPDNEAMFWGRELEDTIAEHWREAHGEKFKRFTGILRSHEQSHMLASPDRLIWPLSRKIGLEVKTAGARQAHNWGEAVDAIPPEYICQVQHYLAVTGFREWHVAALIGGQDYREYVFYPDKELHEMMAEEIGRFWREHIMAKHPPEIDGSESARRYLEARYRDASGEMLRVQDPDLISQLRQYAEAKRRERAAKEEAREMENMIIAQMGELGAGGFEWDEGRLSYRLVRGSVSWKSVAAALNPSPGLIEQHRGESHRRIRAYFKKEKSG